MDLHDLIPDLDDQLADDPDVNEGLDRFMEEEVVPVWEGFSPVATGTYKGDVQVTKPAEHGVGEVGDVDPVANLIEYGTDRTPEFAPRAKTEAYFNQQDGK